MRRWFPRLDESPLYNGQIQSIGPEVLSEYRDKACDLCRQGDSHQLFLEPEGETTEEYYVNGFEFDAVGCAGKGAGQDSRS